MHGSSTAKLSLLSMVLEHGANPNYLEDDRTPLIYAAGKYDEQAVKICEILISHGADVNARNSEGETALHFAARNNIEILKLLLSHSADVNAQDQNGESALHTAAKFFVYDDEFSRSFDELELLMELLLQSGADPTIKSRVGKSPSHNFLTDLCQLYDPPVSVLEDHIKLFARFGLSPSDLIATACEDGEVVKLATGLNDVAILKVLLSHGGVSSDDILRECTYSCLDYARPRSLQMLAQHANPFRVANNKHMAFLFLIKISRDLHDCPPHRPDTDIPMEIRVRTAKPLPLRYPRYLGPEDEYCDILKDIWDAGFDANTILDEKFVNVVSTYYDEFSSLVRDAEQFGDPSSSHRQETISAIVFAVQHVPSATVVLALLKVNSRRDDFTDEEILEAFIRSAVYDNLTVYEECRNNFLGEVDEGNAGREHRAWQKLRQTAEVFPSSKGQSGSDFYRAFCQATRTEGFERKTFTDGRTLFELAERAENWELLDVLKGDRQD